MNENDPSALAGRLRAIREEAGLSIRQLAARMGVHHGQIARIESGERNASPAYLQRFAELFGLDAAELLEYVGIKQSNTLPPLRDYFMRKLGVSGDEAEVLKNLVEYQTRKR